MEEFITELLLNVTAPAQQHNSSLKRENRLSNIHLSDLIPTKGWFD